MVDPTKPADSKSREWSVYLLIALGFGVWVYFQDRAHQNYLKTTSPEQRAIDRDEMAREDAADDQIFRHARGR
jgi:hypothetical protein